MTMKPSRTVLVTGGFGFLGRACARTFQARGWRVVGIGHGRWDEADARSDGFDRWVEADVSLAGYARWIHAVRSASPAP